MQLQGPRQVGKTTEALKFAYENYEYVIYVDLTNDVYRFEEIVTKHHSNTLCMEEYCRQAGLPHYVNNKNTILIIDEIQEKQGVYHSIRTLDSHLDCDIIVAGSYMQHTVTGRFFLPAGSISYAHMQSMSFQEFSKVLQPDFDGDMTKNTETLYALYDIYTQIGGYPAVAREYLATKDIAACDAILKDFLATFGKESLAYCKESIVFDKVYTGLMQALWDKRQNPNMELTDTKKPRTVRISTETRVYETDASGEETDEFGEETYDFHMEREHLGDFPIFTVATHFPDAEEELYILNFAYDNPYEKQ